MGIFILFDYSFIYSFVYLFYSFTILGERLLLMVVKYTFRKVKQSIFLQNYSEDLYKVSI